MWPLTYGSRSESAVNAASSRGISVLSSATANTKGAYVQLIAATAFETTWVNIEIFGAETSRWIVDIAVGAAASEQIVIPDLCQMIQARNDGGMAFYQFPLNIPLGSRVAARCASFGTSNTVYVAIHLYGGGWDALSSAPRGYVAYNILTSDSYCNPIDPGAVANTKGAWLQIVASTAQHIIGFCIFANNRNNINAASGNSLIDVGVGAAASEQVILENVPYDNAVTNDNMNPSPLIFIPFAIPAGSRIAMRCQSQITDATDRLIYVAMYAGV